MLAADSLGVTMEGRADLHRKQSPEAAWGEDVTMSLEQSPGKKSKIHGVETTATEQMILRKIRGKMKPRPLCFKPSRGRKLSENVLSIHVVSGREPEAGL